MKSRINARRYYPAIKETEPIIKSVPIQIDADRAAEQQRLAVIAQKAALIHRGHDETIDLTGALYNPQFVTDVAQTVVSFTMPNSLVGYIDKVAVIYSEPIIAQCGVWNWGLTVNGGLVANTGDVNSAWQTTGMGEIAMPILFSPVWIQSGETVALQIYSTIGLIFLTESYTIQARISGRIYKPASPLIKGDQIG